MQLDRSLQRRFPRLAKWISTEIPKCRHNPRIWEAFLKYSQLTPKQATAALSWGVAPRIDVAAMRSYGAYKPWFKWNRDKIFISRGLCRKFERQDPDIRVGKPWDLIMKATILHEMVHWGDWITDLTDQPDAIIYDQVKDKWLEGKDGKGVDVGFQFENEAFYGIYTKEYL